MNILNREQSGTIITKLCGKFGYSNDEYVKKYINSCPFGLKNVFGLDIHSFPFLWYPQPSDPNMKYINEIWESVLAIKNQVDFDYLINPILKELLPALVASFDERVLLGAGNWDVYAEIGHRVIQFKKEEFNKVLASGINPETYFFPEDLSWVFVVTHEDLSFVAGSKEFIDKIKENFSDHKKYEPEYWKEILGISY